MQDEQRGTGHAVGCALDALPEVATGTVVVAYGDAPLLDGDTLPQLLAEHHAAGNAVTVLTTVVADPTGYGRVVRDADGAVAGIVEHKDATPEQRGITEINSGVYAFDAAAAARRRCRRLTTDNAQGEEYLHRRVAIARRDGRPVGALICADAVADRGRQRPGAAGRGCAPSYNRRLLEAHMRAGVTVVDPATTWIDADVALEPRRHAAAGTSSCTAAPRSRAGAAIGPDTTLTDTVVGAGAKVIRTATARPAIGAGATVGPFAYLRPGTELADARQDRHLRRGQERRDRRRQQGAAPDLRRRRHDRRAQQHRRGHACSSTTTACAKHRTVDRRPRAHRRGQHVRRAGHRRRRRLHRGRLGDHARTCRPARWRWPARRSATWKAGCSAGAPGTAAAEAAAEPRHAPGGDTGRPAPATRGSG